MARTRLATVSRGFERIGPLGRATLVAAAIVFGIWAAMTDPQDGLNGVIVVASLYGFGGWLLASITITRETRWARQVVSDLSQHTIAQVLDDPKHRRGLLVDLIRALDRQHRTSPGSVKVEGLLCALEERLHERNDRAVLTAQLLVTLGLVGTVVGLMSMMNSMRSAVRASGQEGGPALMQTLFGADGPLAGLGTAFSTTLLGTFLGGVLLRMLTSINASSVQRLATHCGELLDVHVLPSLRNSQR